jgi:uncharacterized protein (TIGR01244 family)
MRLSLSYFAGEGHNKNYILKSSLEITHMIKQTQVKFLLSIILLSIVIGSNRSVPATTLVPDIENFDKVDARLYRGAQPDKVNFAKLAKIGIKTIINLRHDPKGFEQSAVEAAGMRYIQMPLRSKKPPTDEQINQFLQMVISSESAPVFVHCEYGRHRTGVMVAIYRMNRYKWSVNDAFQEMDKYGFDQGGHPERWRVFLKNYYNNQTKAK